jgi:prepilin-type N-terminal cleavage/methylation domain-containing protein
VKGEDVQGRAQNGFTLIELVTAMSIIGLIVACTIPAFTSLRRHAAVRSAAAQMRTLFHQVRLRAIARGHNSGVKFVQIGSDWTYAIYDDGDGDGVRNDDIVTGVDRCAVPARRVLDHVRLASMALPPHAIVDPDGQPLKPTASAVQFNRSTICSFSPLGESTPGTLYLTDNAGEVFAVRVYGATAKMRVLRYDAAAKKWRSE